MGWPGDIVDAMSRIVRLNAAPICHCFRSSHALPPATPLVNQPARVAGNRMIEEAKIGGITPDKLSLNGRCQARPPEILLLVSRCAELAPNFIWPTSRQPTPPVT